MIGKWEFSENERVCIMEIFMSFEETMAETMVGLFFLSVLGSFWLMVLWIIAGIIMIGTSILVIIGVYKLFVRAGIEGFWSFIPFASSYYLGKMVWGEKAPYIFLMYVPYIGTLVGLKASYDIGRVYGKSVGFSIGVMLLPCIFLFKLGLSEDKYIGITEPLKF